MLRGPGPLPGEWPSLLSMATGFHSSGGVLTTVVRVGLSTRPAVGAARWDSQCSVMALRQPQKLRNGKLHH